MSIQGMSDHDLRILVRYGATKFAALALAELDRRAAAKAEDGGSKMVAGAPVVAAAETFPNGRWS